MTSSKTFVTSSLRFKQFLFRNQKLNPQLQFEPSIHHFFKNFGNNVTNNDVMNSTTTLFISALKNQLWFKI